MFGRRSKRTHNVVVYGDTDVELETAARDSAKEVWGPVSREVVRDYWTVENHTGTHPDKKFTSRVTVREL